MSEAPTCPFCGTEWTAPMLARLDAATHPVSCACCGGEATPPPPRAVVSADILCDACGQPIYRAMVPAT